MTKVNLGHDTSGRPLIVDDTTLAKVRYAEAQLGFTFTIIQGSYRAADPLNRSGGTHDDGGVIDLRSWDIPKSIGIKKMLTVLRESGLICWKRNAAQGFPDNEVHCIDYGNPAISPAAHAQVVSWRNGGNGLTGPHRGPDDGPRVTIPKEVPVMAARIDGVDLSHWQSGSLDFGKAKAAGARWIYHKATEGWGARGAVDSAYNTRRVEVHKAGLPFGAYHFARPRLSNGRAQAVFFLATAKPRPGDMRPMLDLEDAGGLGRAALTRWVGDFVAEVVAQTGVPPMLYTNFDLEKTFDCPLWVARYSNAMSAPKIPAPWKTYSIWQFSNGQFGVPHTVPGLGAVDINTMNGNPTALTKAFTLADKPTNPSKPTTPTEPDMPLTQDEIDRIAKAVAQLPVVNKDETGKEVSKGTLLGMLSRLDQNVDKLLAAQETTDPGNPPAAS
jgi:GH25 family lysozyme M1 (1,4-beta-N-acetylmuramidase)